MFRPVDVSVRNGTALFLVLSSSEPIPKFQSVSGLFSQDYDCFVYDLRPNQRPVTYIRLGSWGEEQAESIKNPLAFLPEKVVIRSSSNGLLCCLNYIRVTGRKISRNEGMSEQPMTIYVCNPTTKEWIALEPPRTINVDDTIGLAFYPSSEINSGNPCIKLVTIKSFKNSFSFAVFSSEKGRWTTCEKVFQCNYQIYKNKVILVGHAFHWLTWNHHVIFFYMERKVFGVIEPPCLGMDGPGQYEICLGDSEGYVHYVRVYTSGTRVWMLKDYGSPVWVLKQSLDLAHLCREHETKYFNMLVVRFEEGGCKKNVANHILGPLAFHEELLFFNFGRVLYSYSFKTKNLQKHCYTIFLQSYIDLVPTILPYSVSLASTSFLKRDQFARASSSANKKDAFIAQ